MHADFDLERRQGGIARLYGEPALERLRHAHMVVVGVGGVGSWAAEALARSGVGQLTLIDLDQVAESNINRQIQALGRTVGQAKVDALADRIADINPACRVLTIEEFVDPDNAAGLLDATADVVLDCCDQVRAKAAMAALALQRRQHLISVGAAGGKRLAHRVDLADLADVRNDPLLSKLRYRLRREHGAARAGAIGVRCVYSLEPVQQQSPASCDPQAGLNCAGYGSSVMVTASFGMVAAAAAIERVTAKT